MDKGQKKYRIKLIETIGAYGQEEWTEDYDTEEEAKRRIITVNVERVLKFSEWEIMALETIERVE